MVYQHAPEQLGIGPERGIALDRGIGPDPGIGPDRGAWAQTDTSPDQPGIRDMGRLYRELSRPLERAVRRAVRAPDPIVEDACQFAWSRLVHHRSRVCEASAFGWLVKTATHEAFKLSCRSARELSLDEALQQGIDPVSTSPEPWELLAQRERIASVRELAIRPRRIVLLHALGLSYAEMAAHERCSKRTVDR